MPPEFNGNPGFPGTPGVKSLENLKRIAGQHWYAGSRGNERISIIFNIIWLFWVGEACETVLLSMILNAL